MTTVVRRIYAVSALLLLPTALAACRGGGSSASGASATGGPTAASPSYPIGSSSHTVTVGGLARTFLVYRPARLLARAPLVVMMHGGYGSATQAERSYGWDSEAAAGHFLVAYPDGLDHAWDNGGGCCGKPAADHVNDVAFITTMVSDIEHAVPVDRQRVYATGISNGGIMAYTLACHTDIFAAIGPDSATELGSCPAPAPVSVIHIHGTADTRIPYNGGRGDGAAKIDGPAIPALLASWRGTDRCGPPRAATHGTVTTSAAPCPGSREVELITIAGAGHQWPGGAERPVVDRLLGLDPPSHALDATQVFWQFFASHPKTTG